MKKKSLLLTAVATLGLTAATMAQNVPNYVPTNGLVGWWPFNGNANDESGNGNNGTVNGASLSSDRFGNTNKAYSFDGLTNWINVSNNSSLNPTNAISISAWVNTTAVHNNAGIVGKWNNGLTNAEQYVLQANGQGINFYTKTNIQTGVNEGIILYNNGSWHNYVGTWNGNVMRIYRDGILIDSSSQNGNIAIQIQDLEFGRYAGGQSAIPSNNNYFTGKIDDIGIWNRALTACEIKKLYASGSFSVSSSSSNTICVGQSLNLTAAGATTYTWSTGATSQSISVSPTVSTVYTVSTTYSLGCTDSRTFSITVNACTGLNEAESVINSVLIFPNPAKEYVSITAHSALIGKVYSISDHLGKHIATGVLSAEKTTISLHGLAKGFYFLNVGGKNYKIIKE